MAAANPELGLPEAAELTVLMQEALQVCGYDEASTNWLIAYGLESPYEVKKFKKAELHDLHKMIVRHPPAGVTSSLLKMRNIITYKFWIEECIRTNYDPCRTVFTEDELETYTAIAEEYDEQVELMSSISVDRPEPMKKMGGWTKFKERFTTYLSQVMGAARIPLDYVVRQIEELDPDIPMSPDAFDDHPSYLYSMTLLTGTHFRLDNRTVYQALKRCIVDGEAYTYIKKYNKKENGRDAWLALFKQCEGLSSVTIKKNQAYAQLRDVKFMGVGRKYTLEDYTRAHESAHNDLIECNEEPAESKKVNDYLAGIKDPALDTFKSVIYGDAEKMASFDEASSYMLTSLATKSAAEVKSDRRNVSAVSTGSLPDDFKLEDKYYPKAIFSKMSDEQKAQLAAWGKKKKQGRKSNKPDKRVIKALKRRIKKLERKRAAAASDDESSSSEEEERDNAGQQFGRGVHVDKKKSKKKKKNGD